MIYIVGVTTRALLAYHTVQPIARPNLLVSFARPTTDTGDFLFRHRNLIGEIVLDSGTYSLNNDPMKFAKTVTFDGYQAYLKQLGNKYDFYFNYDRDFSRNGFETNWFYQCSLEKEGLMPIPVVHDCYGPEIQHYIDHGYKTVAIGSGELAGEDVQELYRIVDKMYSKGIRVHFLGCTDYTKLAYVPVNSADSATWNQAASRGHLLYWNPLKSAIDKKDKICFVDHLPKRLKKNHIDNHPHRLQIENYLNSELNCTIDDLKGSNGSLKRLVANIHYYVQLENTIRTVHRQQGFKYWI